MMPSINTQERHRLGILITEPEPKYAYRLFSEEEQNSSPLVVTVRTDTVSPKNPKNAGFAPIEAILIILLISAIAFGCTPCQKKKTLKALEKITKSLIGDKTIPERKQNETQATKSIKIKTRIQTRNKSTQKECSLKNSSRWIPHIMRCFHPMQAWYSKTINESGKRSLVFTRTQAEQADDPIEISCGQCIGCRLKKSKEWALRCVHEKSLHKQNSFITLTFSPEALAKRNNPYTVDVRDYQLFMKKLRKHFKQKIRYFHCGEYGDYSGRPHYHAILFGLDFEDKIFDKLNNEHKLYTSETLNILWGHGKCWIGDVTFQSCAYVARYIMKKVTGDKAEEHYEIITDDGEIHTQKPEYITMSRRPGIAKNWFDKFHHDLFPSDNIHHEGKKHRVPKFYLSLLEKMDTQKYDHVKYQRYLQHDSNSPDNTIRRLEDLETIQKLRLQQLVRTHDMERT